MPNKKQEEWTGSSDNSTVSEQHKFISDYETTGTESVEGSRVLVKLIFVVSIATVVCLAHGLLTTHWLLPYYYAVAAPTLITIRYVMYWKMKYQYFLIDFCYLGNVLFYVYIWALNDNPRMFMVMFGITNGPMMWATIFFRNSLVFHSTDKMTSLFIHLLPAFVTYCIRWYPGSTSSYWYSPFLDTFNEDIKFILIWLIATPMGLYVLHSALYMLVVYGILRPSDEYTNSYRYLRDSDTVFGRAINGCGKNLAWLVYHSAYWSYCLLTLSFAILLYKYFIAHSIFMCIMCILATWNGASYYVDVFSVKGFHAED